MRLLQITKSISSGSLLLAAVLPFHAHAHALDCDYSVSNDWGNGFTATITLENNTDSQVTSWQVSWSYDGATTITNIWNAEMLSDNPITAGDIGWNGTIAPGASTSFGFQGAGSSAEGIIESCKSENDGSDDDDGNDDDDDNGDDGDDNSNTGKVQFVGNITTSGAVRSDFVQYWDQITPENEGKWGSVERSRDSYNWSGLDAAYNYAKANNIPFKQHTFVWGSQYPNWIGSLSASEQAAEIEEWIRDYCNRYPDTDMIDVVNESTPGHAPASFAANAFGSDWIIDSFKLAKQYCPDSELILNDYNVLSWNTDEFIAMAKPAVNAGVVDAIGVQAHGLESWSASQIEEKLNKLANELGLPIYVSEYDINKASDSEQLSIMQSQFPVFYEHPSVVGITLWGYVHGTTWRDNTGLIYSGGTQRPAMTWLMNYLDSQ